MPEPMSTTLPGTRASAPPEPALERAIGVPSATALVVGIVVGASIFVQPSEITREVPSLWGTAAVWLAAGALALAGALIVAELASAFPHSGGVYVFLRESISPGAAFLWGWAMFWSMQTGILAAVAVVFARYLAWFLPVGEGGVRALAIGAILLVSAVNAVGVRYGNRLQASFTWVKVLSIVVLTAMGFTLGTRLSAHFVVPAGEPAPGAGALLRGLAAGLFAFGGWHMVTYTAGETRDAARSIPRALLLGLPIVALCYLALNAMYLYVLPLPAVVASTRVAADAADAILGSGGAGAMSARVLFSACGGLSGLVLTAPRVYQRMAEDGLAFRWLGAIHPRWHTPHRALVLQALWATVLVATGSYRELVARVVYTEWIFFAVLALGLLRVRRRPDYRPAWRLPGAPVVVATFVLAALAVAGEEVAARPGARLAGLALVAAGLPVYLYWTSRRARKGAAS